MPKPNNTPQLICNLSRDNSHYTQGLLLSRRDHNNIRAAPQQTASMGTFSPHTMMIMITQTTVADHT